MNSTIRIEPCRAFYFVLALALILPAVAVAANHPPIVTNVVARQVGQQVEIVYDLEDADGDLMRGSLLVSSDGAAPITFTVGKSGARILKARCGWSRTSSQRGLHVCR